LILDGDATADGMGAEDVLLITGGK